MNRRKILNSDKEPQFQVVKYQIDIAKIFKVKFKFRELSNF